jgi:phosphate transport system substrate-binding protein
MRAVLFLLACATLALPLSSSHALAAAEGKLTITGSTSVAALMVEIAKRFETRHPGVRIDVQTGGSSRGLADTKSGLAQIGMVSRQITPADGVVGHVVARDGVAMIVHAANPVKDLSREQIVAIYTGRITDWSGVGGKAGPITVVNKAEGRATLEVFCAHFGLKNADIKASSVIGENEQGIKTVAGNPGAIGYVSIGTAQAAVDSGVSIRLLPMGGIAATAAAVQDGTWPMSRPLNLVTKGEPEGLVKEFLAYALSKDIDDLINDFAIVPPKR